MQLDRKTLAFLQLPSSKGDLYAPPSGSKGLVQHIVIHNTNTTAESVVLNYHNGTNEYEILSQSVAAGATLIWDFRGAGDIVEDGGKYTGNTTTASKVTLKVMGTEETPSSSTAVVGAGSYLNFGGTLSYEEAATPVEEIVGQNTFDASLVAVGTIQLTAVVTVSMTPGTVSLKLYDLGPVGSPAAPRLVSTLTTSTDGGPQVLQQVLTTVAAAPGTNELIEDEHLYEVTVTSAASTGDTVFVGCAKIEVV